METMIAAWWTGLSFAGYPAAGKTTFEAERERISAGGKRNSDS
jgi:tRNA uridine 5-carbamoylmethylation protein Kti12